MNQALGPAGQERRALYRTSRALISGFTISGTVKINEKQQKDVITAPPFTLGMRFIANEKSKNTSYFYNHCKLDFSISTQCFLQIASS